MDRPKVRNYLRLLLLILIIAGYLLIGFSFVFIGPEWRLAGVWAGRLAIILLWITALPGIFRRFQAQGILKQVQVFLLPARRRLGILVFTFALMHYLWVRVFGYILFGPPDLQLIPLFETLGFISFLALLLLFITSNDLSVRLLKKSWQRVHFLVYPVMWLLVLHTTLQPPFTFKLLNVQTNLENLVYFGLPTLAIAILQISSWVYVQARRQGRKKKA